MGISIDQQFDVAAPVERVWSYLIDPARVVRCLPGAELVETAEDGSFVGRVKVKVGPVVVGYSGRARFTDLDASAHRARLSAEGRETGGAGSARMTMSSEIVAHGDGGSSVRVNVDLEVVGKLVQFGRGMIEEVSRQMFGQFSACVRSALEAEEKVGDAAAGSSSSAGGGAAQAAGSQESGGGAVAERAEGSASAPGAGAATAAPPPEPVQPLRLLPLLWSAFGAWLRRLFGGAEDGN